MVFPSRAVWIEQAGREAVVASANRVVFHNLGVGYQRSLIDQRGEDSIYVTFAPGVFAQIVREIDPGASEDPDRPFTFAHGPVDARAYLAQRRLARRVLRGEAVEAMEVEETMLELARELLRAGWAVRGGRGGGARASTLRAHRELARAAEDALARGFRERVTLSGLARQVHSSPYHLARIFRAHTGMSVHGYLRGLRLRAGLVALEAPVGLSDLGLSLGFSSHAHFTTSFKREFGVAPSLERAR
ncbi:MAG: helix-turn-helix transcriptional regulator [Phycisphaerales bacterium JB059]